MADRPREVQHQEPVWRDRADFVVAAHLDQGNGAGFEQLMARQVGDRSFEVCCIPFFLYDMALGDIVETDSVYVVQRVTQFSGRYVFRVWFGSTSAPRADVAQRLQDLGALIEWSSTNLLAVDATDVDHAQTIANELQRASERGEIRFETGRTR